MSTTQQSRISHVSDASFAGDVEQSAGVAVVKFTADWCPPCRILKPILEALATEYAGRVSFHELDTDANQRTTIKYGVRGLPTTIVFSGGKEATRIVGAVPKEQIQGALDRVVSG